MLNFKIQVVDQKIIVLRGKYNTGKTTTLLRALKEFFNIEEKSDIYIKFKYNGHIIAVFTEGDWEKIIKEKFKKLNNDFDLLLCCCRTRKGTYQFFRKLRNEKGYDVYFIDKKPIGKETISDNEALDEIKKEIPFEVGNKDINSKDIIYL